MRVLLFSMLVFTVACGGRVDGNPGSFKADTHASKSCAQVRGSKYAICGTIDGTSQAFGSLSAGFDEPTDAVGTTYAVRGGGYAR